MLKLHPIDPHPLGSTWGKVESPALPGGIWLPAAFFYAGPGQMALSRTTRRGKRLDDVWDLDMLTFGFMYVHVGFPD